MEKEMLLYKKFTVVFIVLLHTFSYGAKPLAPYNILFILGRFPAESQIFILNIITGLIDKGHNVSIFSFNRDKPLDVHPNIKKYKLLSRVTYKKFPAKLPKYDIVFCQFGYLGKKIFEMRHLSEWLKKRKVVVCFRGSDITAHLQKDPKMYKRVFKEGNLFLPVCDYFRKKLIALGCRSSKIEVHHSAIDCSQFFFITREKPKNDIIHLVSVCRLVKKKGLDYAIKAFAEVIQRHPKVHYTIVGEGEERTYLELLIHQLHLQDNVTLQGWQNQDQVVSILDRSHIFLLPSRTAPDGNEEGIPNALKEAMAMGLISIGTWHAGTPELIEDGISGFLVPEKNVHQLANTIDYIIGHPEIWESVGLAARKKVEDEFEAKQSIEKLEKLFYTLLQKKIKNTQKVEVVESREKAEERELQTEDEKERETIAECEIVDECETLDYDEAIAEFEIEETIY
jgi:colanic acid/amylovoran biosynthesis glycosyltransferase